MSDALRVMAIVASVAADEAEVMGVVGALRGGSLTTHQEWRFTRLAKMGRGFTLEVLSMITGTEGAFEDDAGQCFLRGWMAHHGVSLHPPAHPGRRRSLSRLLAKKKPAFDIFRAGADGDESGRCDAGLGHVLRCRGGRGDAEEARRVFERGAARGSASCMEQLAHMLPDVDRVMQLYSQAASLGHPTAINQLAVMHRKGRGFPKNKQEARRLFAEAAELLHPVALYNLGVSLSRRNQLMAAYHLKRALREGVPEAAQKLLEFRSGARQPYSYWTPDVPCNRWVSKRIKAEMRSLLMMANRRCLVASLPKGILLRICFFLCTRGKQEVSFG